LRDALWPIYEARGWYHATIALAEDVLAVLAPSPGGPDRWETRLSLMTSRAKAITLLRGYSADAEDAYAEALALVKEHGVVPQLFPVLRNLGSFHGYRGEVDKAIEYATEILRLADAEDDASMRVTGYTLLGANTGFAGDLQAGLRYLEQAIDTFESSGYEPRRVRLGLDSRVSCLTSTGFFLWFLGFPDRAMARAARAVALATELDHPYSLAYAYYHAGFLHLWRREPETVLERAASALEVAETSDLPLWQALATCLTGAARSGLGDPDAGIRLIAEGIDQYTGLRTPPVFWPMLRWMQAGAHADAGLPAAAFPMIDESLTLAGADGVLSPLFHIVRGDLSMLGSEASAAAAIESYERALDVSARVGARMTQLRAATRLVRISSDADRAKRVETLHSLHATFTEGLETPDLVEAGQLLS
jgi:tetratricopeptide (TPR) repeat protein